MKKVLTIAGSDCSGGAGIQADIKTISQHKMYALSVITAVTAQNTKGVTMVQDIDIDVVEAQLDAVLSDIPPDAIKIGMLSNKEIIQVVAKKLKQYNCKNIVVDPVMVATSGDTLLEKNCIDTLKSELLPLATIITPNVYEAEILSGLKINNDKDVDISAKKMKQYTKGSILIKGGHNKHNSNDTLFVNDKKIVLEGKRINNPNTHGTGCTLSSAIACNLAKGLTIEKSVQNAKTYITNAISENLNLGNGRGPLWHFVDID